MSKSTRKKGSLIIIGGKEAKDPANPCTILSEVARRANARKGPLIIITVATNLPKEVAEDYTTVFHRLGVSSIEVLDIRERAEAFEPKNIKRIEHAALLFFTGGDQLRITSQIGDSLVYRTMLDLHNHGVTIAGTSAGAAAAPETMLIGGKGDGSLRVSAETLGMAPGLGLIKGVVVDSHFAERGRLGRLLGAVAQNPRNLGLGIDEDTAVIIETETQFRVLGSGAVYALDGSKITFSSLSEQNPQGILSVYNMTLHVLGEGDTFDLLSRQPHQSVLPPCD